MEILGIALAAGIALFVMLFKRKPTPPPQGAVEERKNLDSAAEERRRSKRDLKERLEEIKKSKDLIDPPSARDVIDELNRISRDDD